jgi:hypothetical protein
MRFRGPQAPGRHDWKAIFKGAAVQASTAGPFHEFYTTLLTKGMNPAMAERDR